MSLLQFISENIFGLTDELTAIDVRAIPGLEIETWGTRRLAKPWLENAVPRVFPWIHMDIGIPASKRGGEQFHARSQGRILHHGGSGCVCGRMSFESGGPGGVPDGAE
jgi:hypothetical protein